MLEIYLYGVAVASLIVTYTIIKAKIMELPVNTVILPLMILTSLSWIVVVLMVSMALYFIIVKEESDEI